jgi:hypothetical protein
MPQVGPQEAKNFSSKWTYKGLAVIMDEAHLQFSTDFANCVLRSFIEHCQQQAFMQAKAQEKLLQEEQEKHKIVLIGD